MSIIDELANAGRDFKDHGGLAPVVLVVEGMGELIGLAGTIVQAGWVHLKPYEWETKTDRRTGQVYQVATGWEDNGWLVDTSRIIAWRYADQLPHVD